MKLFFAVLTAGCVGIAPQVSASENLKLGSKSFTESVVLAEIAVSLAQDTGVSTEHKRELGGTQFLFKALQTLFAILRQRYRVTAQRQHFGQGLTNCVFVLDHQYVGNRFFFLRGNFLGF